MLRLVGIYDDRQEAHFMLRTRIIGGLLSADQADVIAQNTRDFGVKPEGEVGPEHRTIEISTRQNLQSAVEGETYEYTQMYPGMAKAAREEGFPEIAEWFETLAKAERSHAGRFTKGLEGLKER